jgi:hypothetical protein
MASPIYLISYPRSGSTLCRTYFAILQGKPQLSAYPGDILVHEAGPLTHSLDGLRLVKAHHFSPAYERIVYLIRDGRNAMISHLYLQFLHGGHQYSRPEDVLDGLRHLDDEGHFWGDHVAQAAAHPDVRFVRYEDLIADPEVVLREILAFVGRSAPDQALADAIRLGASSDAYRRSAFSGYQHSPDPGSIWAVVHAHRGGDYWREILDSASRRWFHERGGTEHLLRFGYETSEDWWH